MRVDRLTLKNFRCFESLEIDFDKNMTVLVAQNGGGKTAILDAVRIAFWPYVSSFDLANNSYDNTANNITVDDIRLAVVDEDWSIEKQMPCMVDVMGDCLGVSQWQRYRTKSTKRGNTLNNSQTRKIMSYAQDIQSKLRSTESIKIDLPVLGYYGTGRLWSNKKRVTNISKTNLDNMRMRTYGYLDCFEPASKYKTFEERFVKVLLGHQTELIQNAQKKGSFTFDETTKFSDFISVVRQSINTVLAFTEYENIGFDVYNSQHLILTNKHNLVQLKIEQLSDGIRNTIGMVADIAFRCYQLNPHLGAKAALEAQGVILIDEVDMHLHPQWQQVILTQLQQAFPKLQFIVTTHSPQVLSTVPAKQIRVIKDVTPQGYVDKQYKVEVPNEETRGVTSGDILSQVMGTHPRPDILETQILSQYKALIQQNQYTTEPALALRQALNAHFGECHPQMMECERLIRLVEFKNKLSKREGGDA